ncbi:LOW QUALITY PROTEIN: hypothetical protein TorRG33x02_049910 [Trema orientale]|uniref:Uncharacterized protein n=1 Tax=Trema orientale TaxID=63057 RepID=A0A2P5FMU6_TREOI|nr:LOW QUALITY PROTEIN: hypothetical protein TorRG33x02_049910 [Trema orientale]
MYCHSVAAERFLGEAQLACRRRRPLASSRATRGSRRNQPRRSPARTCPPSGGSRQNCARRQLPTTLLNSRYTCFKHKQSRIVFYYHYYYFNYKSY